ncbi:MAG TPA: ABC transporter permease [Pyrinomonadaceae bacterium]|jgi:putative ABC transport system permease protein
MGTFWQDWRYGLRMLRRKPALTLVIVLTLGVSIGINTAVFSVVYAALMRPLPFKSAEQLMVVLAENKRGGVGDVRGAAPADFVDWRKDSQSFEALAAFTGGSLVLNNADAPEMLSGIRVSDDYFRVLGVPALMGRTLAPEEFVEGGSRAVVLSYGVWKRRFGGDPNVLGKTMPLVGGGSATVVGVMPEDFKYPSYADIWSALPRESGELQQRGSRYFTVIGRLKEGVTQAQAQEEMSAVAGRLAQAYPQSNADWGARLMPLRETLIGKARKPLLILFGAVLFVLAIACANVANLLLARATARYKEIAIRAALGASRWRVIRQLLVESMLLALVGGGLGVLLAFWGVDLVLALVPEELRFARLDEARVDWAVLTFTLGVSLLTGIITGLLPGLRASRPDLIEALKETGKGATSGWRLRRLRGLLVVAEVAVTLVLLVGAGLLVRNFVRLQRMEPGFDPRNLLTMQVAAPRRLYGESGQRAAYYKQMQDRLSQLPGVRAAAATSNLPLDWVLNFSFEVEGRPKSPSDSPQADYSSVSPNYFDAMGIALRSGRKFTEQDRLGSPDVVIISETMARRVFPGEDPLGKRLALSFLERRVSLEIVGVVADVRQDVAEKSNLHIYDTNLQRPWLSTAFVVRADSNPQSLIPAVQRAIREVDANRVASDVKTMEQVMSESVSQPRFYTQLLSVFAALALLLAAVGIYGLMSFAVTQRTHEIGIRIALGARAGHVVRMVVRQGMSLVLAGVGLGLAAAFVLTRLMQSLLFEVTASDPLTFIFVALLLAVVAFIACYIPARRATRVDPMTALRYE